MLNTVGVFIYIQYWEIRYVEHRGKIYSSKILGNTLCWTLWEYLFYFTRNTGNYFMMSTVRRFIYNKILGNTLCWALWEYLFTQNTGKYFMLSTMRRFIYTKYYEYFMLNTVERFIYTKYWEIRYVEYCGSIYFHTILGNMLCWTPWENLFTQNTGKYFMLNTGNIFLLYTKYWELLYVERCGKIYLHKYREYFMLNTVGRFIYTKYWGILYVEHCGKIYLHKILGNTLCWALWEDLFTQNTGKYFDVEHCEKNYLHKVLWILYVEHCGNIYLHKILENTLWWALWEDLFTQNTGNTLCWTLGRFIYTKYWEKR